MELLRFINCFIFRNPFTKLGMLVVSLKDPPGGHPRFAKKKWPKSHFKPISMGFVKGKKGVVCAGCGGELRGRKVHRMCTTPQGVGS